MKIFKESNVESLSNQKLTYFNQDKSCREARVFEWLKAEHVMKKSRKKNFMEEPRKYNVDNQSLWYGEKFLIPNEICIIPGGINTCTSHFLCLNDLLSLYNISYQRLKTIEKIIKSGKTIEPTHLLVGSKINGAIKSLIVEKLNDLFVSLQLHHIKPHATKVVWTTTGIALRNDNDIAKLPISFNKRQIYCSFLFGLGWCVKPKSKLQNQMKSRKNSTGGQKSAMTRIIKNNKTKNEKRPGLRNIKQVDLYHKWGPLVPEEFRDDIYLKPSGKIIKSVTDERKVNVK